MAFLPAPITATNARQTAPDRAGRAIAGQWLVRGIRLPERSEERLGDFFRSGLLERFISDIERCRPLYDVAARIRHSGDLRILGMKESEYDGFHVRSRVGS